MVVSILRDRKISLMYDRQLELNANSHIGSTLQHSRWESIGWVGTEKWY